MAIRIPWDKYEVALLLKYTLDVEAGLLRRSDAVAEVSKTLRSRAISKGIEIDEFFRNTNGISMQMSALRNCYLGVEKGLTISKLFRETVELYTSDQTSLEYILQEELGAMDQSKETANQASEKTSIVDFSANCSYAHTKPTSCTYKGISIVCAGWNALYINLVRAFYMDHSGHFPIGQRLSASARIDIGNPDRMIYPKEIADGIYLECNISATGVINKIRSIMSLCSIAHSDVVITYVKSEMREKVTAHGGNHIPEKCEKWEPMYAKELVSLLSTRYQYGFRLGSPIEMIRLRNYAEARGVLLPESDEVLEKEIAASGELIDGKIYALSEDLLEEVGSLTDNIFAAGVQVIFLDVFLDKNSDWLEEHHVMSIEMLRNILKKSRPHYYYGQNIITNGKRISEHDAVVQEIIHASENNTVVYFSHLETKLCYIPSDKIAWSLSVSPEFVWISEGKYYLMKHFILREKDADAIRTFVKNECNLKGYASITDLPFGNIPDDNFELSVTALYAAVYGAVLSKEYYLHGKIITKERNGVDISTLLRTFCSNRAECLVADVLERATELTGSGNKQYSMEALLDTMVRADAGRFVSEDQVHFDVTRIDDILANLVGDRFLPIKGVTTFALFPSCGISWNHFVLESYCYRFSNKYQLVVINFNDKNAGIIKSKTYSASYTEMLCEAAAMSGVDLTSENVGNYFFDNGFTAKRKYANLPEIVERAITIREER